MIIYSVSKDVPILGFVSCTGLYHYHLDSWFTVCLKKDIKKTKKPTKFTTVYHVLLKTLRSPQHHPLPTPAAALGSVFMFSSL